MHYCTVLLYIALHACIPILHVVLQKAKLLTMTVFFNLSLVLILHYS